MKRTIRNIKFNLIVFLLSFMTMVVNTHCSVELRANRKVDKAIMLTSPKHVVEYITNKYGSSYLESRTDTIIDTIVVNGIKIDTMFITKMRDTVIFQKDGTEVKIIRLYDTIYANIKSKNDTIYSVKTYTQYIVVKDSHFDSIFKKDLFNNFLLFLILVIFAYIIYTIVNWIKKF